MIEEDKELKEIDRILDEIVRPLPLVEMPESNIQFNGKQKVLTIEERRDLAPIISGCTPEEFDRMIIRDKLMGASKNVLEFEERMKKFDEEITKLLNAKDNQ